jgi:hypothetical protein
VLVVSSCNEFGPCAGAAFDKCQNRLPLCDGGCLWFCPGFSRLSLSGPAAKNSSVVGRVRSVAHSTVPRNPRAWVFGETA